MRSARTGVERCDFFEGDGIGIDIEAAYHISRELTCGGRARTVAACPPLLAVVVRIVCGPSSSGRSAT